MSKTQKYFAGVAQLQMSMFEMRNCQCHPNMEEIQRTKVPHAMEFLRANTHNVREAYALLVVMKRAFEVVYGCHGTAEEIDVRNNKTAN